MKIKSINKTIMIFFIIFVFISITGNYLKAIEPEDNKIIELNPEAQKNKVVEISNIDYNYLDDENNPGSKATLKQLGDSNYALIEQVGQNNFVRITQINNENSSEIFQAGNNNFGNIAQIGNNNNASVKQNNYWGYRFGFIGQVGDDNEASIDQQGEFNFAAIAQFGNNNEGHIWQTKTIEYDTKIQQNGDNNSSRIMALSLSNNLTVEQHGSNQNIEILIGQ